MGIPQEDTIEMTGAVKVSQRTKAWQTKRVIFLTPQVLSSMLHVAFCASQILMPHTPLPKSSCHLMF